MRTKQVILIFLLLIAFAGCVGVVSAEDESSDASATTSLVSVSPKNVEELNNYPMFKYRDNGGAIEPLSSEEAAQFVFKDCSFMSYEPNGKSLFVIALATEIGGDQQYAAIIDLKNIKGQFSKGGLGKVWTGVKYYQASQSIDAGNYKAITKVFMNQRNHLSQGRGIVLIKCEEKTE